MIKKTLKGILEQLNKLVDELPEDPKPKYEVTQKDLDVLDFFKEGWEEMKRVKNENQIGTYVKYVDAMSGEKKKEILRGKSEIEAFIERAENKEVAILRAL